MASAAMRTAIAAARGNFFTARAGERSASPGQSRVAASASGRRRNQLRAQLRAKGFRPTRFARGGVMPVEAKHSAVPESKVRGGIVFFFNNNPRPPDFPPTTPRGADRARAPPPFPRARPP